MSDSPDNVVRIGGSGGLLYQDAREQARRIAAAAEDFTPDLELPEPEPEPRPEPPKVTQKNMPPEPVKPGFDWRELFSTCVELLGITAISVGGWLIAPCVGLIIAGVALILVGVATSRLVG